jgi:hypothetical protein
MGMQKIGISKNFKIHPSEIELNDIIIECKQDQINDNKKIYNCGCCDNCLCDDNVDCKYCGCGCSSFNDNSDDEEIKDENNTTSKLNNLDINVIKTFEKEKKVRISLELEIEINSELNKIININLDINKETFYKILKDLD